MASWRSLHRQKARYRPRRFAPFGTFVEAEEACEFMLMHLTQAGMTIPIDASVTSETTTEWTGFWHLWWVAVPRRSITGRIVRGHVWRRHDGRKWTYKKIRSALDP